MGFLARCCSTKRPQLALRGESPGFSRVAAGFFSSYDGDLRDPLVGPQRGPVSTQITRGPSGFLCSRCPGRGSHLDLSPEPQVSSPVPTWISVFLWASGGKSGLVSCGAMQVRSPLDPEKQCQASSRVDIRIRGSLSRCHRLSHLPSCFESILGMNVESMQGSQGYLECIGTLGSFGMVTRPLEFLSTFKCRPPPLEL